MRIFWTILGLALLGGFALATQASAATIRMENGEACTFSLNGPIERGDAQALRDFLETTGYTPYNGPGPHTGRYEPRLCLNSPGGSLAEAAEIAEIVFSGYATRIRPNEQCLSACAWIFMLGRTHEGDDFFVSNRAMSAHARLGFHSPSLPVLDTEYSSQDILNAINAMNEAFSVILDLAKGETPQQAIIGYDLVQRAMATPSTEFFYIDTVGKVLRWGIEVLDIGPFDRSRRLTQAAEFNACDNVENSLNFYDPSGGASWAASSTAGYGYSREVGDSSFSMALSGYTLIECEGDRSIAEGYDPDRYSVCITGLIRQGDGCLSSALALFPADQALSSLTGARGRSLYGQLTTSYTPPARATCALVTAYGRIGNVEQFTNLRSRAGIDNPIITQVPLGATVSSVNPNRYYATQRCLQACDGTNQFAIDQCIDNNEVWVEVIYNRRSGFLSRRFVEPSR